MKQERSIGLDIIRSIAILLVVLAHFSQKHEHVGFWGVEMFFALSGFLIGQILWKSYSTTLSWGRIHIVNFWSRRWWRTLPNYYLFLLLMIPFHLYLASGLNINAIVKSVFFVQNLTVRDSSFFGISLSLCIEEWFYLLFPLLLFIQSLFIKNKKTAYLLSVFVIIVASIFYRAYLLSADSENIIRGITLARLDSIVFGVLIAFLFTHVEAEKINRFKYTSAVIGLFLLVWALSFVYMNADSYELAKKSSLLLTLTPLGFACLLPIFSSVQMKNSWLKNGIINISLWSYSIYLSHIPIVFLMYSLFDGYRDNVIGNLLSKICAFIATLLISAILYKYFEMPLTEQRPKDITVK